jgi:repressor LexA
MAAKRKIRKTGGEIYAPNRIAEERKAKGLSTLELSLMIEASPGTVNRLENRKAALSVDYMLAIAKALNIPAERLLPSPTLVTSRALPILGRVACGNWREAISEAERFKDVEDDPDIGGPNAFVLEPEGDSMDMIMEDARWIVVDPDQPDLIDGKFYVIMNMDGETTFKRFRADPARLEPSSSNPDHKPILVGREPFTVIGRVTLRVGSPQ